MNTVHGSTGSPRTVNKNAPRTVIKSSARTANKARSATFMPPVHPELVEGRRGRPALAGRGWMLMADSSWFAVISKLKLFILPLPPPKGDTK